MREAYLHLLNVGVWRFAQQFLFNASPIPLDALHPRARVRCAGHLMAGGHHGPVRRRQNQLAELLGPAQRQLRGQRVAQRGAVARRVLQCTRVHAAGRNVPLRADAAGTLELHGAASPAPKVTTRSGAHSFCPALITSCCFLVLVRVYLLHEEVLE